MNANGKIFNSIKDRSAISEAYNKIFESEAEAEVKTDATSNTTSPSVTVLKFLTDEYPNMPVESLEKLDMLIGDSVQAEDGEEFTFFIPDVEVEFHIENDGIGRYEYLGHEEYDAGHDYAVVDGCDEEIYDGTPDGTVLMFDDDYDKLGEQADEYFQGSFDWDDEDGRGTYSSFSTTVKYTLYVTNPVEFKNWVETISREKGIVLDGGDTDSAKNESTNIHESDTLKRSPARIRQDGPNEYSEFEDEESLDGKINLRGKAANLRDYELERASHFANILACYNDNKAALEKLEKDLEHEGLWAISTKVSSLMTELELVAEEAEDKLGKYQRDVRQPYHIGTGVGFMRRPNYVSHERFSI